MAAFSETLLLEKLGKLNDTAESINMTSAWILYHKKHFQDIARIWAREIRNVTSQRKLAWVYLANDVVQQSKRRGDEVCFFWWG
jgi:regulator of Ty1 transposition protein 103